MTIRSIAAALGATITLVPALAQPGTPGIERPGSLPDNTRAGGWAEQEGPYLTGHVRLTSPDDFLKAGEAYFDADSDRIIFQAIPHPAPGEAPDEHYSMYLADLEWVRSPGIEGVLNGRSRRTPIGLANVRRISPEGSANTCGWFDPIDPDRVIFASTLVPPSTEDVPGYQRGTGTYRWAFPTEMTVVSLDISRDDAEPEPLFVKDGYTAEGSLDPTSRSLLFAQINDEKSQRLGRPDADILLRDLENDTTVPLVVADGYDGGPFFNADASWITYRSDRRGDNLLQIFVAELDRDANGGVTGIARELQLTDDQHVNWAPYFHPSAGFILYTTSRIGHFNYELFAVGFDQDAPRDVRDRKPGIARVTVAPGFDGLGVYSNDGDWLMWTSQRGDAPGDPTTSSQLWIARAGAEAMTPQRRRPNLRMPRPTPPPVSGPN